MTSTTVPNGSPPGHPNTWTVEDVGDYLELSGLKSQAQLFKGRFEDNSQIKDIQLHF